MSSSEQLRRVSRHRWITTAPRDVDPDVLRRCDPHTIGTALSHLTGASVHSVALNQSGQFFTPPNVVGLPRHLEVDLPDYCEVVVHQSGPGGHIARVEVWVPLVWNGRFLGTGGAGNRTSFGTIPGDDIRLASVASGIRNGFAAASSDGAIGADPRVSTWALNEETKLLDGDLIENWIHRSTHDMTVIGKVVTAAIHGIEPRFSYFQGGSGGGRQALAEAQRYPEDYDGIWAVDPAINWHRMIPAEMWPLLVMKELDDAMAPDKFEAFRAAAVADFNAAQGSLDPFIISDDPVVFDAHQVVGQRTDAGVINELDAKVMNMIWDGPRAPSGEQLWFGLRPGVATWGEIGLCTTVDDGNGGRKPHPFAVADAWLGTWLLRDPQWNWQTLTFETYAELFERSVREFACTATDDPNLGGFRDAGSKLLLTHGADDQVIFSQGSRDYFDRVLEHMGGQDVVDPFARFFLCPGDGHVAAPAGNCGVDLATGSLALMHWVENGIAPDTLEMLRFADDGVTIDGSRTANAYRLNQRGPSQT